MGKAIRESSIRTRLGEKFQIGDAYSLTVEKDYSCLSVYEDGIKLAGKKQSIKMEDASRLLRIPTSECPDVWIRLPLHKWPKS